MEPPYLLSCVACFLIIVLGFGHSDPLGYFKGFFPHFAASFFYQHNLVYGYASWVNGITWTLEINIQFYLIAPLLARLLRIRSVVTRRGVLLLLILGFSLLSQFVIEPSGNDRLKWSLANQIQFFLAGFVLADLAADRRDRTPSKSSRADAAFLVAAVIFGVLIHSFPRLAWYFPFLLVPLFAGVLDGKIAGRFFRSPILAVPGAMCYTIFLYHELTIRILLPYTFRLSQDSWPLWVAFGVQMAVLLPAVLLVSVPLFLFVEKPFMILSRNVGLRREARVETFVATYAGRTQE
jgi:peptidoglycan/LPS O-acetylase OafA/YrhL